MITYDGTVKGAMIRNGVILVPSSAVDKRKKELWHRIETNRCKDKSHTEVCNEKPKMTHNHVYQTITYDEPTILEDYFTYKAVQREGEDDKTECDAGANLPGRIDYAMNDNFEALPKAIVEAHGPTIIAERPTFVKRLWKKLLLSLAVTLTRNRVIARDLDAAQRHDLITRIEAEKVQIDKPFDFPGHTRVVDRYGKERYFTSWNNKRFTEHTYVDTVTIEKPTSQELKERALMEFCSNNTTSLLDGTVNADLRMPHKIKAVDRTVDCKYRAVSLYRRYQPVTNQWIRLRDLFSVRARYECPTICVQERILTDVGSNLVLEGLTNASGVITGTTQYGADAITGTVRRATAANGTLYKPGSISGTTTSAGFSATVLLISDE